MPLLVVDCRPRVSAVANHATGAGYEHAVHYPNTVIEFMDIENIHAMRQSQALLAELCRAPEKETLWHTGLDQSRHFHHLRCILLAAVRTATALARGQTVLVHCSDGWDRTSQVVALAQLMCDPFFRTLKGFAVLVEKEWIGSGHQFASRSGHGARDLPDSPELHDRSPVFLQFLDCVHQLLAQHPGEFEFNYSYLVELADALYSCRFGTFLADNRQERQQRRLDEQTVSFWTYAEQHAARLSNPFWLANRASSAVLIPDCATRRLRFWSEYFLRFDSTGGNLDVPCVIYKEEQDHALKTTQRRPSTSKPISIATSARRPSTSEPRQSPTESGSELSHSQRQYQLLQHPSRSVSGSLEALGGEWKRRCLQAEEALQVLQQQLATAALVVRGEDGSMFRDFRAASNSLGSLENVVRDDYLSDRMLDSDSDVAQDALTRSLIAEFELLEAV
eukprot:TRINITY_DN3917_c0_g1_i5.p1 TRINITY_DN3917_c0_g1~~TRINITY_DN3917_c0_g1_i5.p1  ORF type:complete len:449 (+),score=75.96 TRINITY_DN3917_c0_g1_i5:900-2246(+)